MHLLNSLPANWSAGKTKNERKKTTGTIMGYIYSRPRTHKQIRFLKFNHLPLRREQHAKIPRLGLEPTAC